MTDEAEVGSSQHHVLEVESLIHTSVNEKINNGGLQWQEAETFLSSSRFQSFIIIKEKLGKALEWKSDGHSIYKIPASIRDVEPKAFQPQIVSVGPYHRGAEHLTAMEKHKWRLLKHQLENPRIQLEELVYAMTGLEEEARASYDQLGNYKIDSQDFIEMMLLDGCFILEILDVSVSGNVECGYSFSDPVFNWRSALPFIQRDLLMLENQLPMCVLKQLFPLVDKCTRGSVYELAFNCFHSIIPGLRVPGRYGSGAHDLHLLNLVREWLVPTFRNVFDELLLDKIYSDEKIRMHSVMRLRESGIKFVRREGRQLMDIMFEDGNLYIPQLEIHDSTKPNFLNLMAFEQCFPWCSNQVTSYMSFMDGLIDSSKDVEYLREKGIIHHTLGSDNEVAHLFNNCCKEMAYDTYDPYFYRVSVQLNAHFDKKWNRWRKTLKQDYLRNPWVITSLFAASFLLLLTWVQTTYAVVSYHHPSSQPNGG